MAKPISQQEARRLRKRVRELEGQLLAQRRTWASEWPGGVYIEGIQLDKYDRTPVAIRTARKLGHAVVALANDNGSVYFCALPL